MSTQETLVENFDLSIGKSPVNVELLLSYLEIYPNVRDAEVLKSGFVHGFRLGFSGERVAMEAGNLKSARLNSAILKQKIEKEVACGRFAGPFKVSPIENLRVSPVGLVPKADGDWRLITHLSYPKGCSVNDGISEELASVQYTSLDKVADMIFQLGKDSLFAKRDIKSAFRLLPVSPEDFCLLGLRDNEGNIYIDKFLPMGCRISCSLFEKFATFLQWLVVYISKRDTMDHYLDDFIFAGAKNTNDCSELICSFASACDSLGVPIAREKSVGPCTKLIFLGLEIDSVLMIIRIPLQKMEELREIILKVLERKKVVLKEFQSLVGKLAFCSRAIRSSRAFLRRFYDVMITIKRPHHRLNITESIKEDLKMWLTFLDNFNGVSYIPPCTWFENERLQLFTDSAGSCELGCGCFYRNQWVFFPWPKSWQCDELMADITFLEMVPVILALILWGKHLKNKRVLLRIDNEALVIVINKQTSKSKRLMQLVRHFVLLAMEYGIIFKAMHIPSHLNSIADSISRKQWDRFRVLAPDADKEPQQIPARFRSLIYSLRLKNY